MTTIKDSSFVVEAPKYTKNTENSIKYLCEALVANAKAVEAVTRLLTPHVDTMIRIEASEGEDK